MNILVTGSNGLVGNALDRALSISEHRHTNTARSLEGISSHVLDITDYDSLEGVVKKILPDVIINSAAMADVDKCEEEREKCWSVNVDGVKNLVNVCERYGAHLVHLSLIHI